MGQIPRTRSEEAESYQLAPYAAKAKFTRGRIYSEAEDTYRTCYQRDRDRILYTAAFKNLQYKTQVFVVHEGDFYRTRLAHTLEVMQHARTFARALKANEDLVESIALAHDLGHAPFGHAGEEVLAELLKEYGGFDHNLHSLRVVDYLEEHYPDFPGLNLSFETREGIARHCTRFDQPNFPAEFAEYPQTGIEAQIVNLADSLAFAAHDLDDALRVGLVLWEDVRGLQIPIIKQILAGIDEEESKTGGFSAQMRIHRLIRHLIYRFNEDLIINSGRNLERLQPAAPDDIRRLDQPVISLSPERARDLEMLLSFLFDQVYKHPTVLMMAEKGKMILERLFRSFWSKPQLLPTSVLQKSGRMTGENTKAILIGDYLAGLTDRQAMDIYEMMFEPYTKVMGYGFGK
ncbi:MAG: deoxyguanosinetriphosphate triphosphohydrolase [Firmicutes bacterium]|nr:deoxyguanosinetriphosphate triphosphohydrolase [Bacillota bacterium]